MLSRYESVSAFADDAAKCVRFSYGFEHRSRDEWASLVKLCKVGNTDIVPRAEALLASINADLASLERRQWHASPYGAYTVVPEFLAGIPCPMRRMLNQPDDNAPVNIYIGMSLSAGVDSDANLKRGIALLALVQKLQAVRPCELYLLEESNAQSGDGWNIHVVKLDTQPLNLAVAAWVLTDDAFPRGLMYSNALRIGGAYAWPAGHGGDTYNERLRAYVGASDRDILFSSSSLYYAETKLMLSDPVAWVNKVVGEYNARMEELEG